MRKTIVIISIVLVVIIGVVLFLLRSDSGFKSIYFVPEDAFVIIETPDPIKAWNDIVSSNIWDYYKSNPELNELNNDIQSYDSLVRSNKLLWKIMGEKALMISFHPFGHNNYESLYILDVGKIAKSKNPEKLVKTVLGKDYEVTSRKHHEVKIVEVYDKVAKDNYFLSMWQGKAVFSFEPALVEKAIEATEHKFIGRDMRFLDVKSEIAHKGLFQVYLNYKQIGNFLEALSEESAKDFKHNVRYMKYSGLTFDIDKNDIVTVEGFTSLCDTAPENYLSLVDKGGNGIASLDVIPKRLASMVKINFNDPRKAIETTILSADENNLKEFQESITALEKRLKINVDENIFSWMHKEIILLQTKPSNLGRSNEFAMIIHAKDSIKAADNLNFVWHQIKKNTPVKIKSVNYKGYKIDYVAFPGIIQAFFGKTLDKLEKPYFTQIGKHVICSNHPQTLKNLIDDYLNEETMASSINYHAFSKVFNETTKVEMYAEPPVLFQNMRSFVDAKTWQDLKKNEKYITCFKQAGLNISKDKNINMVLKAAFSPKQEKVKKEYYNPTEIFTLFNSNEQPVENEIVDSLPIIIISNLDDKKHIEYYDDGSIKLEVKLKDGKKDGQIKIFYPNGEIKLKGHYENDEPVGKWRYYSDDGELIKTDEY